MLNKFIRGKINIKTSLETSWRKRLTLNLHLDIGSEYICRLAYILSTWNLYESYRPGHNKSTGNERSNEPSEFTVCRFFSLYDDISLESSEQELRHVLRYISVNEGGGIGVRETRFAWYMVKESPVGDDYYAYNASLVCRNSSWRSRWSKVLAEIKLAAAWEKAVGGE